MQRMIFPVLAAALGFMVAGAAAAQSAVPAGADSAAKLAEARAIIAVMYPPAERKKIMDKLLADGMRQFRTMLSPEAMADPGIKAMVDDFLQKELSRQSAVIQEHFPEQLEAQAVAYAHQFTLAELNDIHAFALTKSGNDYFSKTASILDDPSVIEANIAAVHDMNDVSRELIPQFQERLAAYLKVHPDLATRIKAEANRD